ncbi:3-oxoacyl-[acyl-carrier-protein] reductase [bacterium]|nr:3-oxoacyl-[acyl-carrier-protein] reductase [bacterium]MBU1073367.1 3-oxoacyl-[acyl-carrier-protein] reductase [bacterium]MBU1675786.1 3-oxoacyl-[acyl-carrier-protein] reductase [bacterium]
MSDKAVIITGAARGIGLAIARTLASRGYDLALVDIMEETVAGAAASLAGDGKYLPLAGNVADWDSVQGLVERAAAELGPIYGVVNNAGITRDGLLLRMQPEAWQQVLDVNLTGTFYFTKAVAPLMMRQKIGRIVNIASVVGLSGNAGQANYAASKAGVIAMTKSVAKELGGRAITCNAIAPGFIATDMTHDLPEQVKLDMLKAIPLKRLGSAEDVAAAVAFLLSEDAAYITGQTIVVDGGMVT